MTTTPDSQSNSVEQAIEEIWDKRCIITTVDDDYAGPLEVEAMDRGVFFPAARSLLKDPRIRQSIIESLTKEELDQVLEKYFEQVAWRSEGKGIHQKLNRYGGDNHDIEIYYGRCDKGECIPVYVLKTQPEQNDE